VYRVVVEKCATCFTRAHCTPLPPVADGDEGGPTDRVVGLASRSKLGHCLQLQLAQPI